MTMRSIALRASLALDHKRRWKRALHHVAKRPNSAFWHPGVIISNTLSTVWTAYRGSVVKCILLQVRPFTKNDEAHGHITEHMRDLGERLLHAGDFSYEDITGQDEPPVDLPTPEENTATRHQKTDGEGQMDVDPKSRRHMRGKTRLIGLEQPSAPTANTGPDTTQHETKEDHDDKRRRIDEPEPTVPAATQDEVLTPCPETFDLIARDDEIAVDVALPGETVEMSGENSQGWITDEAFFTVSPGARQVRQRKEVKMNKLSPAGQREFLKSMEVEWQTLLQNQAAKVLSLEEAAQAQARWSDRAMNTRWARTWKPCDSKPSGRRAKARLIIKGFTDHLDIESHSPTLTREGFMTVLQSVCSHGPKLHFGDVQQAFNTGDPIKREQPLCVRMPPDQIPGEPRAVWVKLLKTVNLLAHGTREWRIFFPCCCQTSGVRDVRHGTVCFSFEGLTTKIPWYHWGGRRRHCWWRRQSLGTGNLQVEETFHLRTLGSGEGKILQS